MVLPMQGMWQKVWSSVAFSASSGEAAYSRIFCKYIEKSRTFNSLCVRKYIAIHEPILY